MCQNMMNTFGHRHDPLCVGHCLHAHTIHPVRLAAASFLSVVTDWQQSLQHFIWCSCTLRSVLTAARGRVRRLRWTVPEADLEATEPQIQQLRSEGVPF